MRKILMALAAGVAGVVGVFFARAEGLITAEAVSDVLFGLWYSALALLVSWVLTAFAGSRHRAWAMGSASSLMLVAGIYRWGVPPIGWLACAFIVGVSSPFSFAAAEAALAAFGVRLRKGADGEVEAVKVGDDPTIFVGAPTELPDEATVPKEGVKPEPSND